MISKLINSNENVLAPAPKDLVIKSDPNNPSSVIITWQAPSYSSSTGKVKIISTFFFILLIINTNLKKYILSVLSLINLKTRH